MRKVFSNEEDPFFAPEISLTDRTSGLGPEEPEALPPPVFFGAGFLVATTPLISVIEVGQKNRYGHPTEATLNRLKAIGSAIYRTDENGTVRLRIKGGKIAVYPEIYYTSR